MRGEMLDGRNPFYSVMPDSFRWIGLIIATLAAIVASQAIDQRIIHPDQRSDAAEFLAEASALNSRATSKDKSIFRASTGCCMYAA